LDWVGRTVTVREVVDEVAKDIQFYNNSGGGVTFSGGEPLFQPEFLKSLSVAFKKKKIHMACETNLIIPTELVKETCSDIDLLIVDIKSCGKDVLLKKNIPWIKGDLFSLWKENLKTLVDLQGDIWIRIPLVKDYTDNDEYLHRIVDFLQNYQLRISRVELLPYHFFGVKKRKMLGMKEMMFSPPSRERLEKIGEMFSKLSIPQKLLYAPSL
jgi:pyruvate formate lyase activating enzyme